MSYQIEVEPGQRRFRAEALQSILDAAQAEGIELPSGCRGGYCGDCKGRVLSGQVRYPDGYSPTPLTDAEIAQGFAICCMASADSDLRIRIPRPARPEGLPLRKLTVQAGAIEHLTADVVRLYLNLPAAAGFRFLPGQYIEILHQDGRRRAFSIANSGEAEGRIELHLRLIPGGEFTRYVFDELKEGDSLEIEGPKGKFCLYQTSTRPMIMMAGGTGFAPIKGIIEHALETAPERPIHLYRGARRPDDLYLNDLAAEWAARSTGFKYTAVLSDRCEGWQGRCGMVHEAVAADYPDLSDHEVYMAGPPPMIDAAKAKFTEQGLKPELLFFDAF
jgi:CDP-4-dehydro-6-deoxyglucose reductase, E3